MKKIKTFEAACEALGIDPNTLPDVSHLREKDRVAAIAHYKLMIIIEALNEGWEPDWKNSREYKYYPYFDFNDGSIESGFGFSGVAGGWAGSHSHVGSRLVFKSAELVRYAAATFIDIYREYHIGK